MKFLQLFSARGREIPRKNGVVLPVGSMVLTHGNEWVTLDRPHVVVCQRGRDDLSQSRWEEWEIVPQ